MNINKLHTTLIFIGLVLPLKFLLAQTSVQVFNDFGNNQSSGGNYLKASTLLEHSYANYQFEAGLQFNLVNTNNVLLSGYKVDIERTFYWQSKQFNVNCFYLSIPFSNLIRETNWGLWASYQFDHLSIQLGTHYRVFAYTNLAKEEFNFIETKPVSENWNLIYTIGYNFLKRDNFWNVGLTATNYDHFQINQETNPIINVNGQITLNESIDCFAELWYKTAGTLNLNVNYYGYFLRTGIVWKI